MANENKIPEIIRSSMENIRSMFDANKIIGDPITTPQGTTIIPISKISVGIAASGFDYNQGKDPKDPIVVPIVGGLVGYVEGLNVVQTPEAVRGIYFVCNIIPALCYALQLIGIGLIFNLDKKKTDEMYADMAAKRAADAN